MISTGMYTTYLVVPKIASDIYTLHLVAPMMSTDILINISYNP